MATHQAHQATGCRDVELGPIAHRVENETGDQGAHLHQPRMQPLTELPDPKGAAYSRVVIAGVSSHIENTLNQHFDTAICLLHCVLLTRSLGLLVNPNVCNKGIYTAL